MIDLTTIFYIGCFIGYFVVWGVTPALYSPLMRRFQRSLGRGGLGAVTVAGFAENPWAEACGLIAVVLAAVSIFGGFAVSARMLSMFKTREKKVMSGLIYLTAAVLFILAIRGLSSPRSARSRQRFGNWGMTLPW